MKSLTLYRKLRNELEKHRGFWNYYGINFDDVFRDETAARNFIFNYFKGGSKLYALDTWANSMDEYIQMRNIHTVNVFFIGAYIQRQIDEKIAIKSEVSSQYSFSYIWYLLCLAHDLGYAYERDSKVYLGLPEKHHYQSNCYHKGINRPKFCTRKRWYQTHGIDIAYLNPSFRVRNNITYYNQSVIYRLGNNIEFNNGLIIKSPRYSGETKNNYFYYRLYEMQVLDHGIVGADEFFSKLALNYVREYRGVASGDFFRESIYEFYNEQGLHFCSEQFKIFAYISDCIASHNMYKADDTEICKAKYMDYALNCLMPDKFKPISYKDNPFLFILCVADTIEPSKKFPNYSNVDVLNLISIEYSVSNNSLYVEVDEELYKSSAGHEYVANIEELKNWCDIKTTVVSTRFKQQ